MRTARIIFAICLLSLWVSATTRYVATTGSDSADCSSGTPCLTIGHVVSLTAAGDTILVHAGKYQEAVSSSANGTAGNRITLKAYGDGEVILDASTAVSGWTLDSGSVYKATPGFEPINVIVDNVPLAAAAVFRNPIARASVTMAASQWFYDLNTSTLYVQTADGTSPASHDVVVLSACRETSCSPESYVYVNALNVGDYWTVSGIMIRGARNYGVGMGNYATFTGNKVWFNTWTGTSFGTYATITNNTVAWNMMGNWPRGLCTTYNANQSSVGYASCWIWGGWGGGLLVGGGYATVTGNQVYMNGGEGLISYLGAGNNYVHGNTVYDNWSVNIYMDSEPYDTVDGNLVYCDDPSASWSFNSGALGDGPDLNKRIRPTGISTADECYAGCGAAKSHDQTITNNLILGCRYGLTRYNQAPGSGMINETWAHNTIVLPATNGTDFVGWGDYYVGIMTTSNANYSNSVIQDNIVYGQGTTNLVFDNVYSSAPNLDGLTVNHNLFYHPTNSTPFEWQDPVSGGAAYTYAQWEAILPGTGDVNADPALVNATTFMASDKALSSISSPAYHAGVAISGLTTDYAGNAFASPPSMGAMEYGSTGTYPGRRASNYRGRAMR